MVRVALASTPAVTCTGPGAVPFVGVNEHIGAAATTVEDASVQEMAADETAASIESSEDGAAETADGERRSLAQKVRDWLGRAA